MTCRIDSRRGAAPRERIEPAVERPKRIDTHIDDVANGDTRRSSIASNPGGEEPAHARIAEPTC